MLQFGSCPRCQSTIDQKRLNSNPVICQVCGFSPNISEIKLEIQTEKRFIKTAIAIATVMTLGFIQVASWDQFAIEIIPLKTKQMIGAASQEDLSRIAEICKARFKHDCVEQVYADKARSGHFESLAELGKYQSRRGNKIAARQTLNQYFTQGGLDLEASYQYAKVLGELGQVDLSTNYYDQVLNAKPDTLQISVTQNYVRMLLNNGRSDQAKKLIESIRKTAPSAAMFMETEYKAITQSANTNR